MKRCPKCNRSYPDDNQKFCTLDGGLLAPADQAFDPNATIHATTELSRPTPPVDPNRTVISSPSDRLDPNRTVTSLPTPPPMDPNRTAVSSPTAPTEVLDRHTGPTGAPTVVSQPAPPSASTGTSAPLPHQVSAPAAPAVAGKKSKAPLIIGVLLLLLVLGVGAIFAAYVFIIRPRMEEVASERTAVENARDENRNSANNNTVTAPAPAAAEDAYVPPPNTAKFTNSAANLEGKLAEHYFDFSFYYPTNWQTDPKAGVPGASNFAKVERRLPPDFTQENFAVGWYTSKGTFAADESTFPQLVDLLGANLARGFPGYQKVSQGPTKINSLDGYEFRFVSESKNTEKGDIQLWGRVVFLPPGVEGADAGATLIMLATSLAPELSGVEDVGAKGEMPVILDSFRFGPNKN